MFESASSQLKYNSSNVGLDIIINVSLKQLCFDVFKQSLKHLHCSKSALQAR